MPAFKIAPRQWFFVIVILTGLVSLAATTHRPQDDKAAEADDRWAPFASIIGQWEGEGSGMGGHATKVRTCKPVLNDQFLQYETRADFPKQDANPEGELHLDLGMISFDSNRDEYVMREYYGEGFMIQFVGEVSPDGDSIVFTSELIESYPPGWRARITFTFKGEDEFDELLELAPPEQDYFECRKGMMRRKK